MRIIGVTGGMGSGKSTVSHILSGYGAVVIDADQIGKEVVLKGKGALEELTGIFGSGILNECGELDRKKLGEMVFNSPEKLEILNKITHKYIIDEIINRLDRAKQEKPTGTVVIDAPIPVEHGFIDLADEIWVVVSGLEERIARVVKRSGLTREEALNRINCQKKDEDYIKIADKIIYNSGTVEQLETMVKNLFKTGNQGGIIAKSL